MYLRSFIIPNQTLDDSNDKEKQINIVEKYFRKMAFLTITIFAFLPFPFDAVGLFCGAINYPVHRFFLATLLGRVLRSVIIAWSGNKIIPL